jgi:threonine-phosphate decarboxylase
MMTHGADIYTYAKIAKCFPQEIIDFSSNINLYQPNTNITFTNATITKYAQSSYEPLKESIATNYNIKSEQIALYNGATAAIYALLPQLKPKKVYLYAPLYGEYEKAAFRAKKFVSKINRIEDIDNPPAKKSIVIFVNPSTPEGSYHDMQQLLKMWMKRECTIILDESFLEFEELKSARGYIKEYKKLYIIQSFSKFYSCAGVRIGAIFAHKKSIEKLSKELWNISSLDTHFLQERLCDGDFKKVSKELHLQQKKQLLEILEGSEIFDEVVESQSNFILCYSPRGKELFEYLLKHKILVRSCESFDYLSENWLRFAVKDEVSQISLKNTLDTFKEKNN